LNKKHRTIFMKTNQKVEKLAAKLLVKFGTHRKVAEELGVSEEWYSKIRNGNKKPSGHLVKLMEFMVR